MKLNENKLADAYAAMRALVHPLRLRIISYIDQHENTNVNKIYHALKLEQSITSQHLKILRDADLVRTERNGKYIHYSLNYAKIEHMNMMVMDYFSSKV